MEARQSGRTHASKYVSTDRIGRIRPDHLEWENVVRCKYFEAGVHTKNPIKNSYQDGLGRIIQTLDHIEGHSYYCKQIICNVH
jgi:hypothetical protein